MSLSSLNLDAFLELARSRNFSRAAERLHITQSALSQRIQKLEEELGTALFVREPSGVRMTETAEQLLAYTQQKENLERDFLSRIQGEGASELSGVLRVSGFSTVMRSLVLPVIAELVREHPAVQIELSVRELRELSELLRRGETDFVLADSPSERSGMISQPLGFEENVLVTSKLPTKRAEIYLDHDLEDTTTARYFQGKKKKPLRRSFLDEIYTIMDGVALGLGEAVVPKHLAKMRSDLKIVDNGRSLEVPVYLQYYQQAYYSKLHGIFMERLQAAAERVLLQH